MKTLILILYLITSTILAQGTPNSLLKNFKPFDTPRTNCRPGTIYRIYDENVKYIVQDVKQIKSEISKDGTLIGQMTFSKEELLAMLNLNFNSEFVTVEVEIRDAMREYTEQANIDKVLWDDDLGENLMVDNDSEYFLIRETISSREITFRFNKKSVASLITGKSTLKEKGGEGIDFPFEIKKKFGTPKRFFYLEEEVKDPD
jgi:hypothetical protein